MSSWWDKDKLEVAKRVLASYPRLCHNALQEIGDRTGRDVTTDALCNAFRRNGLNAPGSYCQGSPVKPEALFEMDCDLSGLQDVESLAQEPTKRTLRAAFIGDVHEPYTDPKVKELGLSVLRELNPDIVATMGDTIDAYSVSDHDRDPTRVTMFEDEVDATNRFLDSLERATPNAGRRIYVEGNHEWRLPRFLKKKAPALFKSIDMQQKLRIKDRGLEWVPYFESTRVGYLNLTHDCGRAGRDAHVKAMDSFQGNVAIGHTHQLAIQYGGSAALDTHVTMMCGWWGSMDSIDWMHKVIARHWQHGICVGYLEPSGVIHLQAIPFVGSKKLTACLNGELVRAA